MPRRRRKRGEERISEKDLEVLEFVARFGLVPRSAVAVRAKTGRSVTLDRERRLREGDLIEAHPAVLTPGALLTATRRGLRLCGREELRPQRYSLWSIRHAIVLAHVAARLELAGERLLSERELAAAERLEGRRLYSAPRYRQEGWHRPDLIRLGPDGAEAIEVELTNKAPRRLEDILRGWRVAVGRRAVSSVIYLCPPKTLRHVAQAVRRTSAEELIAVQPLTLPNLRLPRPASQPSGGLGAAVEGLRPDPLRGLTAAPPPLTSRPGRGRDEVPWR
jgi:hypothetical protein